MTTSKKKKIHIQINVSFVRNYNLAYILIMALKGNSIHSVQTGRMLTKVLKLVIF